MRLELGGDGAGLKEGEFSILLLRGRRCGVFDELDSIWSFQLHALN